jgi:hypothetical protein
LALAQDALLASVGIEDQVVLNACKREIAVKFEVVIVRLLGARKA